MINLKMESTQFIYVAFKLKQTKFSNIKQPTTKEIKKSIKSNSCHVQEFKQKNGMKESILKDLYLHFFIKF